MPAVTDGVAPAFVPVLAAVRLLLAATLTVAALAKLPDDAPIRATLRAVGLPAPLPAAAAPLVPLAELGIAAALSSSRFAILGAGAATLLFLGFVALLGRRLASGGIEGCSCFGAHAGEPTPLVALLRAQMLATLAFLVLWLGRATPEPTLLAWLSTLTPMQAALVVAGELLLVGVIATPSIGRSLVRLFESSAFGQSPAAASAARAIVEGFPAAGVAVDTAAPFPLGAPGAETLVLFVDTVAPTIAPPIDATGSRVGTVAVTTVDVARADGRAVADAYGATAVPSAVIVARDGRIASRLAVGPRAIEALLEQFTDGAAADVARAATRIVATPAAATASAVVGCVPCGR